MLFLCFRNVVVVRVHILPSAYTCVISFAEYCLFFAVSLLCLLRWLVRAEPSCFRLERAVFII